MWLDVSSQNPAPKRQHTSTLPLTDAQVDLYFLQTTVFESVYLETCFMCRGIMNMNNEFAFCSENSKGLFLKKNKLLVLCHFCYITTTFWFSVTNYTENHFVWGKCCNAKPVISTYCKLMCVWQLVCLTGFMWEYNTLTHSGSVMHCLQCRLQILAKNF